MRIVGPGHILFALAAAGLAILNFIYRDFAPIWQPLPGWVPWRELWIYASAVLLLAASIGLCLPRAAVPSALVLGAYLAVWVASRASPVIVKPLSVASWYGVCEALAPLLGAWILYALLQRRSPVPKTPPFIGEHALRVAQVLFGFTCVVYGLAHFAFAHYTATMVPAWLPGRLALAYLTGLGHLAAGIGIIFGIIPRLAAILEALMMSLFGVLVWLPTLFMRPLPAWATPAQNQWSEIVITLLLAASAWMVATSLRHDTRKHV
jgi:uncharacterized membrane protein